MEEPSFLQKVSNFAKTTYDHIKNGSAYTSPQVYQSRMDTCNNCKLLQDGKCKLCGCKMELKARWTVSDCDNDYWNNPQKQIDQDNRL